ncbi:MAG: hypothetical protein NWR72_04895 [Bacteroidia bacterium]|nr:hypothetical protein [Bacteroidia bacterium]
MKTYLSVILSALMALPAILTAQPHTRPDDHFYRRRIVNRIDLREKMNQPIVYHQTSYGDNGAQAANGLVASLLEGLQKGTYTAYHPDDLSRVMSYEEVVERMRELNNQLIAPEGSMWEESELEDTWEEPTDGFTTVGLENEPLDWVTSTPVEADPLADLSSYEQVVQIVEDRIFDKARGEMICHPDLIQLIWTDPGETLPEQYLAYFRYTDVAETLEQTPWRNRFNDAEKRNLREVFELRLFHSFIINVSGEGVNSLPESEARRQQLVEFEHHLWSY